MAVPDYETMMLPVIKFLSDGSTKRTSEIVAHIADTFALNAEERKKMIPSGRAKVLHNRVGWACTYLRKAGLIESPERASNRITQLGNDALKKQPSHIDSRYLAQFEQFRRFQAESTSEAPPETAKGYHEDQKTPEEIIGIQSDVLNAALSNDILDQIGKMDPDAFEQLVVDLLLAMGYGGTAEDAGRAIGRSSDGGIDGVIMQDVLGLETIYLQAKRWKNTVPVKEVRDFAGALMSKKSTRGVFITTSDFPASAEQYVNSIGMRIVLIDGKRLVSLMIKYNLGVTTTRTIEIKEVDSDYFTT